MSRVLCRRGVARGAVSRGFTADHLLDALKGNLTEHVFMELDSGGRLTAHGGRGPAALAAAARLAPSVPAAAALLQLAPTAPGRHPTAPGRHPTAPGRHPTTLGPGPARLALCLATPLPPHAELLLWFADDALAALDMPFLTLQNISARHDYTCHHCGAAFDDPNPLKVHLFLSCAPYERRAFWALAAARLRCAPKPPGPAALSLDPAAPSPDPAAPSPDPAAPSPDPAALEALATAWGRARGGHVCVFCGKLYSRRYGLKIHLRTHTGYRPLRCRYCLRAFGDPSNLNKHVRLHARGTDAARLERGTDAARLERGTDAARLERGTDAARLQTHTRAPSRMNNKTQT